MVESLGCVCLTNSSIDDCHWPPGLHGPLFMLRFPETRSAEGHPQGSWRCSVPHGSYVGSWSLAVEPLRGRWEAGREGNKESCGTAVSFERLEGSSWNRSLSLLLLHHMPEASSGMAGANTRSLKLQNFQMRVFLLQ